MKSHMQILVDTHSDRDYNFKDVMSAMGICAEQAKSRLYPLIFKGQQWDIWNLLDSTHKPTWVLSETLGIKSGNLSKQLSQMQKRTGLVNYIVDSNGHKQWRKSL